MNTDILKCTDENLSNSWDYENGWYLTSPPNRMYKMLAHYELYKKILHLPGEVLEFGVYKGASLIRVASFRNMLENNFSRKIIGFDAFGKFPTTDNKSDNEFIEKFESGGGDGINEVELMRFLEHKKLSENITLIKGDILTTLDQFLLDNPHTKISLLHIDVDVYKPTSFVINKLYERVVQGGLIVLDDYNAVEGATRAVDEFLSDKPEKLQKLPYCYIPSFIEKI